jgi:hypothetical protein
MEVNMADNKKTIMYIVVLIVTALFAATCLNYDCIMWILGR